MILATYLAGILIGGLYLGAVSPVRTVVQADFGIDGTLGIWMINIYSLFYAALIPIIGKLADRRGRNRVFVACMGVFCVGSVLCGLSQNVGGFALLLVGRVAQAAGAGGIIPVANSQIATTFPSEKRGTALGMAAAVMGVSNVLGSALGSAVVGAFGVQHWPYLFYLCVPFCVLVMVAGIAFVPPETASPAVSKTNETCAASLCSETMPDDALETITSGTTAEAVERPKHPEAESSDKADVAGSVLFLLFVLLLLLGIKSIDFLNFPSSALRPSVLCALASAIAIAVAFRQVERHADDPVFHVEYLRSRPIVVTMVTSFFIGCFVISLVLVPELAEYATNAPLGSGGYYILAIGAASIVATPVGGRVIDHIGPKPVLLIGFIVSIAGLLFLALVAMASPSSITLIVGLFIVGAGMGFAMGAPTNYMILENTDERDSTQAIATITLVRQIGTSLAPAILTGLIAATPGLAGYQHMLLGVVAFNACALVAMLFYHSPIKRS
ncbi:MAG: MFS transporter [Eggerthellaceae bacterium]|nr:MFS transporter [Eggerthellaceae bacterium]